MTVVTPAVLDVLPAFLAERFAAHPGLQGVTLFPVGVGPSGSQKDGAALRPLTTEELHRLAAITVLATHLGRDVRVAAWPMINPILKRLGYPASKLYQCTAGRGRVAVHADLGVSTCHPVKDPVYGSWSSGLFDRIPGMDAHRRMAERDFDGCRSCSLKESCGHCRAFVTGSGAPLYGNDEVCLTVVPGRAEEVAAAREVAVGVVRGMFDALRSGEPEALTALLTEDVVDQQPMAFQPEGRAGLLWKMLFFRAMAPDFRTVVASIAPSPEGAVASWATTDAPGRPAHRFEGRFTVREGRISAMSVAHVG